MLKEEDKIFKNLYGSEALGSKYQGQKLPTASRMYRDFSDTEK